VGDEHSLIICAICRNFSFRGAADALDQLGRIHRDMLLEQIPHAAWMLQRVVRDDIAIGPDLVVPGVAVVVAGHLVIAGEQAVLVCEAFLHEIRRIGKGLHVFPVHLLVLDAVILHAEQEGDIAALTDRCIDVGDRSRARIARVDHDQPGAAIVLGFRDPFESARMRFGGVAAHDDDEIGVADVGPGIRHRAAAEGWGQTGHRGAVSNAGLVVEGEHPR
jgi:hypothetical protein